MKLTIADELNELSRHETTSLKAIGSILGARLKKQTSGYGTARPEDSYSAAGTELFDVIGFSADRGSTGKPKFPGGVLYLHPRKETIESKDVATIRSIIGAGRKYELGTAGEYQEDFRVPCGNLILTFESKDHEVLLKAVRIGYIRTVK